MRLALVLSGGGMFGAWQAGAWRALSTKLRPDLIVGASVGSLNGYAIAGGASAQELCEFWLRPDLAHLRSLPQITRALMERYPPRIEYAAVLTDLVRLKARIFRTDEITWQHLAASCAIPGVLRQYRIGRRWYTDGGLLNPLPVWAAVELGATHIVALHALPEIPTSVLKPFIRAFRWGFGYHPPLPPGVELAMIKPGGPLGSVRDALFWKRENAERWIQQGAQDAKIAAKNISLSNCFDR